MQVDWFGKFTRQIWRAHFLNRGKDSFGETNNTTVCSINVSLCEDLLSIELPSRHFIRSSRPSQLSVVLSHRERFSNGILPSFINTNWSCGPSNHCKPWNRLRCIVDKNEEKRVGFFWIDRILRHSCNAFTVFLVIFSACTIFSSEKNRRRMSGNPFRTYLYLNLLIVLGELTYSLGYYMPADQYWCLDDGSLVLSYAEASLVCKVGASLTLALAFMDPVLFLWVIFAWKETVEKKRVPFQTQMRHCGFSRKQLLEVLFSAVYISIPVVMAALGTASRVLFSEVEGYPPLKTCMARNNFNSPALIALGVVSLIGCASAFLLFGSKLWKLRSRAAEIQKGVLGKAGRKSSQQLMTLRLWLRRHVVYSALLFFQGLVFCGYFIDVFVRKSRRPYREAVEEYFQCRSAPSCGRVCEFKQPPPGLSYGVLFSLLVLYLARIGGFSWLFFTEIEWPRLAKLRHRLRFWEK